MLSQYPPARSGIAAYAEQAVTSLRRQGHQVLVASPEPSDAEYVLDLRRPGAGRTLARLARRFDRLVVQFHPILLGKPGSSFRTRAQSLMRLAAGLRAAPSSELRVHEVSYGHGLYAPALRRLVRPVWQLADVLTVHTERERRDFAQAFGVSADRIRVVSHGEDFVRRIDADRAGARQALDLPADQVILLAIGFLHRNKGFDRAVRAFARLQPRGARLYIVGSLWGDAPDQGHLDELRRLVSETPSAELREGFLGDEDFDRWIVASDMLVLPYRKSWSSGVMERGLLYDRPIVTSGVGGMAEQGADRPGVALVGDDYELVDALRRFLEGRAPTT